MDRKTEKVRRKTRDERIYNSIIDAEQEVWNRKASVRADGFDVANVGRLRRLWQRVWYAGCDLGELTLGLERDYHKYEWIDSGTYADIEYSAGKDKRTITRRERFRIREKPRKRCGKVVCQALRIEATDYSATYNLTLSRAVVVMILVQALIGFFALFVACPSRRSHHRRRHR